MLPLAPFRVLTPRATLTYIAGTLKVREPWRLARQVPILLVPGLGSSVVQPSVESIHAVDVMRGEATLRAGLIAVGIVAPPAVARNPGSHWKAIRLGKDGKIQSSVTSLSGELMHVTQE